jgi:ParB-like chromosome segregation protein Spo0J
VTRHPEKIERRAVEKLIPYARNSRTHSDAQVAQIAASIKEWGWTTPILIDETEQVIAGHGRLMAARKLGMAEVPVIVAAGWTDAQKRAYVIADNKLALNAGWDNELLKLELHALTEADYDLSLTGFDADELTDVMFAELVEPKEPEEQAVSSTFEVSVSCDNEAEQERVYELLTKQGLKCRVLTM